MDVDSCVEDVVGSVVDDGGAAVLLLAREDMRAISSGGKVEGGDEGAGAGCRSGNKL